MRTGAVFGESGGDSGRQPDFGLLLQLTDLVCELGCVEDAPSRVQFAGLLAGQLRRPVDIRGVRLREDVVSLVTAALSVAGGEHVLVGVVRILEGAAAGDELARLIAPAPALAGPLTKDDEKSARVALSRGELPAARLRDGLAQELVGLDLPDGLTPEQLFSHLLEWNAQEDGLPPVVVLLDHAARLARTVEHRLALTAWVDDWTGREGLTAQLARRRESRAAVVWSPDIPRTLVVAVEPARDGSTDVAVRTWTNATPGRWDPRPGEPDTIPLEDLGRAVDQALRLGTQRWLVPREPDTSGLREPPAYIEFVLPYDLLNHDVAGLTFAIGDGEPTPLGLRYGVHLRSLERMRTDNAVVRQQWQRRWAALKQHGITVHAWRQADARRLRAWQIALAGESRSTAVLLDAPTGAPALEALKAAIAEGIGLAVWDRRGVFMEERREVVTAVFAAVALPVQLPSVIHRMRLNAASGTEDAVQYLAQNVGFMWDDPTRVVDLHTIDPDDLAS
ncbi:effector-associated domain 2-containing protein [Streptomyces chartreusis]|uniref:VMAP-C domain-containing protein n=1 Tax=Streptomyces chartreusis TaxID=1969 RepID=UPI0033BE4D47